ncbi:MAG: ABC transporter permease [Alistipes sp.]|jgi:lipoprotein-releasing system permease protein|nr:ABC transporter permease [Alistipes sp.]
MAKLNVELFIARRIGGGRGGESRGVMVRIATATTAVGMAVMIVAVAVIMGFRSEITGKISAFAGHLRVQALDYGGSPDTPPIRLDEALEAGVASIPGFVSVAPYAVKTGIVRTPEATAGVVVKGVGADYDLGFFEAALVEGSLPRRGDVLNKDILISASTARTLGLAVDDRVEMLFVGGDRPPRRDRFRVCGLYSSGMEEMDSQFALADIRAIQRLTGRGEDHVTGYEIVIDDMERLEEFERRLEVVVDARTGVVAREAGEATEGVAAGAAEAVRSEPVLAVRSVTGDYPQLFDWLKTHDVNAAVIITIMVVVALVSMVSALLIILLERIRMIGILKTLGMTNRSLRLVFVMRAARIILLGLLCGDALGIGLALLQRHTGAVALDGEGYFLSAVPIELGAGWIAALNVGVFVVLVALLVLPTTIVGRITPEKTIRYQ